MIKLFLITLLCATLVFADLPVQGLQNVGEGPVNRFLSMTDHFMGHGNLVRRSASGGGSGGRAGGGAGAGAGMGGGAGGAGRK